jgi:hypothetical protein
MYFAVLSSSGLAGIDFEARVLPRAAATARARPGVRFDDGTDAIVGGSRVER